MFFIIARIYRTVNGNSDRFVINPSFWEISDKIYLFFEIKGAHDDALASLLTNVKECGRIWYHRNDNVTTPFGVTCLDEIETNAKST